MKVPRCRDGMHIRAGINQDRTDAVVVILVRQSQHQQARLGCDGDFHFVVDRQTAAADPVFFRDENPQTVSQSGFLRERQQRILPNITSQVFQPVMRKRLGQQLLPALALFGREEHRAKTIGWENALSASL